MKNNLKIITAPYFLIGLTILLLNDFILKEIYGNWLTGKLSDFAGLFIFPLFWTAIFPKYKKGIFLFTALFFVFWKSPYSIGFIDVWSNFMFFEIGRVVDYSDLMALFVLPFAYYYGQQKENMKQSRLNPAIPFILALFSFMATSLPFNNIEVKKKYSFNFSKDILVQRLYHLPAINEDIKSQISGYYTFDSTGMFWVHRYDPDTVRSEMELASIFMQDSITLNIEESFCFGEYAAGMAIGGDDNKSTIKLNYFFHRCRKNEWKKSPLKGETVEEKLINSFETKIIQELKK